LQDDRDGVEDEGENFSKYLMDRVRQLEERLESIEEDKRKVLHEKRDAENKKMKFQREVRRLRSEIERLKSPPLVVGEVEEILDDDKAVINSSTGPKFMVESPSEQDLTPGSRVAMNQQTLGIVEQLTRPKDPSVHGMEVIDDLEVDYSNIGGLDSQIQELRETVELPLTKPERFDEVGVDPPKGILLYGPPGTGKTLMAKAVASQTDASFIRVVGSELVQKYIGEGARLVREVFDLAREKDQAIIFIDELDAVGAERQQASTTGDREVQRTLMQLLSELDGFDPRGDVKVVGATNRHDILDPALLRPGRFDRLIEVPLPEEMGREEILKIHTRGLNLADDVDLGSVAEFAEGASGADMRAIAMEAGMLAIRKDKDEVDTECMMEALEKVNESSVDGSGVMYV